MTLDLTGSYTPAMFFIQFESLIWKQSLFFKFIMRLKIKSNFEKYYVSLYLILRLMGTLHLLCRIYHWVDGSRKVRTFLLYGSFLQNLEIGQNFKIK